MSNSLQNIERMDNLVQPDTQRMDNLVQPDLERMDNYVSPSERKQLTRTPAKKRAADQSATTISPTVKRASTVAIKREKTDPKPRLLKSDPKIICGLDFGTTFSGIAYTWSDQVDQITVVMDLDDSNQDNPKVPSAIDFSRRDRSGRPLWGNAAKGHPDSLEWFKLLLVDEDDLPAEVRNSDQVRQARAFLDELGLTAEEAISEYLKPMWACCLEKMKRAVSETTVDKSRIHIVITLPAIWQDYARKRMERAVKAAGLLEDRHGVGQTLLDFVSEPEAAALATLKNADGRCDIQSGDTFVVCDCGGGTVDIISYQLTKTEPMTVEEIVLGAGALCGVIFVNDNFKKLLKKKFDEISPNAWDKLRPQELEQIMSEDWEKIRNQFKGGSHESFSIRHPYSIFELAAQHRLNAANPVCTITSSELKQVFEPQLTKIKNLVLDQVNAVCAKDCREPKYVILVGGFGRCKYLYEYLKTRSRGVEVLQCQGSEPWTAICRGAVIHGMSLEKMGCRLAVSVRSRISRASYGILCQEKWDEKKHRKEDKSWDEDELVWKAKNQMKWLVEKGANISVDRKVRYDFYKVLENESSDLCTTIWMSTASPAPSRKDDSVVKHCDIYWTCKLDLDNDLFENAKGDEFFRLLFSAEVRFSGGATDFFIFSKGRRRAVKNVNVDFQDHTPVS